MHPDKAGGSIEFPITHQELHEQRFGKIALKTTKKFSTGDACVWEGIPGNKQACPR